jgi:hypothetical protein
MIGQDGIKGRFPVGSGQAVTGQRKGGVNAA